MLKKFAIDVAGAVGSAVGTAAGVIIGGVVGVVVGGVAGFHLGDSAAREMAGSPPEPDERVIEAVASFEEAVEHVVTKRKRAAPKGVIPT